MTSLVWAEASSAESFATVSVRVATVARSEEVAVARLARELESSEVKVGEREGTELERNSGAAFAQEK